eukprot:TRINITY_DN2386_c0_g1_i2.p1 TRINITY_DN2386_c0_g1~~TRINITY_DN2386_c0_g1_i2.p1  ORF type:complete len:353 (+),score=83.31 TRINITY_DN2386_c0_g1_i2:750-1808(+)
MNSKDDKLKEQAIWALCNISGESTSYRDSILAHGMLPILLRVLGSTTNPSLIRNGCWALSILMRSPLDFSLITPSNPSETICNIMKNTEDPETIKYSCQALAGLNESTLTETQYTTIQSIFPRLVQFLQYFGFTLRSANLEVVVSSLRYLGSILAGNKNEVQLAVSLGAVPALGKLLSAEDPVIRKEAAWALSNITAETAEELKPVFNSGVMARLIFLGAKDRIEVRRECIWAVSNATTNMNAEQLNALVELGAVEMLCGFLEIMDVRVLSIALEGIINFLKNAKGMLGEEQMNAIALRIEDCGGLKAIEHLQTHANTHIYQKAIAIIENFFGSEEIDFSEPINSTSIFDFH